MPYIPREEREMFASGHRTPETPGQLAYIVYRYLLSYILAKDNTVSWTRFCLGVGSIFLALLEFYSRYVKKYEKGKRDLHGDVGPWPRIDGGS
jgi:hypothetical protein